MAKDGSQGALGDLLSGIRHYHDSIAGPELGMTAFSGTFTKAVFEQSCDDVRRGKQLRH
jgi:hypothetical protein